MTKKIRFVLYPYKMESNSSKELTKAISGHRVYPDRRYIPKKTDFIINWGNSDLPNWNQSAIDQDLWYLNHPSSVGIATNKLKALEILKRQGVSVPEFTTDRAVAQGWGCPVLARTILNGHGGIGCELLGFEGKNDTIPFNDPKIKLFTKYIKKTSEFRVHVFAGDVWDVQQKKKRSDIEKESLDYQIRNFNNGWIFAREGIEPPEQVLEQAAQAVDALELDFGAVDVVWNRKQGAFVLEVNTAPGIEGTTIERYAEAFKDYEEKM